MTIHLLRPSQLARQCARASAQLLSGGGGSTTAGSSLLRPNKGTTFALGAVRRATSSSNAATPPAVRGVYARYQALLARRPFLVQAVQASVFMGAGDLIAQIWLEGDSGTELRNVDVLRTARFCALGLLFVGPTVRFFYGVLDRHLRHANPVIRTLQKVCVDQFVFAPVFMAVLVAIIGTMQTGDPAKVLAKLKREYADILVANYYVWPWVQLVNFRFVPLNYQVPLTQVVAVMWNIYISWKTNQHKETAEQLA